MSALTGTGTLTRFILRRDRIRMSVWVVALVGTVGLTVPTLDEAFATEAQRQARAALMDTPTGILFGGPGFGLDDYTLGAMVVNELTMSLLIAMAIMSILHVVRHTRAEEESGRAELLRAGVLGSGAQMTAALLTVALLNLLIGGLTGAIMAGYGLDAVDSLVYGLGLGLAGLTFGAVTAVCAQLTEHARAASGTAFLVTGLLFMARVVGDLAERGGGPSSWASPFAWVQQTRVFDDLRWWPLALYPLAILALFGAAYALAGRRDLGAGLVPPRPGPAAAGPLLNGVLALHLRQQRGSIIAWSAATFLFSISFGTLATEVEGMLDSNPELMALLGSAAEDVTAGFLGVMSGYVIMAAAAQGILSVLRARSEESAGRAELVLATAVGRIRWYGAALAVGVLSTGLLVVLGGLGIGIGALSATDDASWIGTMLESALSQAPVALAFVAATALFVGAAPRLMPLVWLWLGYSVFTTMLGALLGMPDWALDLSAFGMLPQPPMEEFEAAPVVIASAAVAAALALALAGFRRRDLETA
ncbi:ABC transporter permease [Nocardiopsis changdeensis]|uniref:Anibiotic ABC transporter efflux pump n=1 Tax=Nocardiopsis changdeensis TaxID=2831969 RepID=A0ABX8BNU3_9ACTN|nr:MULTISPECIES: anibiotic ABC transporter efflux pump [Nocardiopsis]QUX23910.1 anibiotic ABC transporter efflux pump [Nocardiopsis changdeensis]QYX39856.1 anibiotic ABC transporter efflux pump [Nocardiopsis sp. MT53]